MIKFLRRLADKLEQAKPYVCSHDYKLIDSWSSDALGIPYGYKTYKCPKCNNIDKQFWYI